MQTPVSELESRMARLRASMDKKTPDWEMVMIFTKVNLLYFTGTMQEGMLVVPRNDKAIFWVRRSYERAIEESLFADIRMMNSYRDAAVAYSQIPVTAHIEKESIPLAMLERVQKYFPFQQVKAADAVIGYVRSIKSTWELNLMEQAGTIHQRVLEELLPSLLHEGMSEAELACDAFSLLVREGHQGILRFGMYDTEMAVGQLAFGENSLNPTSFNGPGGNSGVNAAVPVLGSRTRKLKVGDLVFADIGSGVNGYHTDKTMTYMFGATLPKFAIEEHKKCIDVQNSIAKLLKPGAIPSQIYETIIKGLSPDFLENFMGYGSRQVKFLGHGIGLFIDEVPVIAKGFDEPLEEGMILAIEPKKGIEGVGMVGIENTFVVTSKGGRCITGNHPGLLPVF